MEHQNTLAFLQKSVKEGIKHPTSKNTSHTMRQKTYESYINSLNIKNLNKVLEINTKEGFIVVEPGITMEALVDSTLPFNLVPPVIPEFKGITVGGAINGAALESSSHLFGQFNDGCMSYEILTADGQIITASPDTNKELYYGIAGSYGTLGILLSVKIQLIQAKPWMKLRFEQFKLPEEAIDFLTKLHQSKEPPAVMEAIVFPQKTVVIFGSPISAEDAKKLPKHRLSKYFDPWFYSHVDQIDQFPQEEAIPFRDYLFRHDRGAFWMGGYGLYPSMLFRYLAHKWCKIPWMKPRFCTPKNPGLLFRLLFGKLTSSKTLYRSLHGNNEDWFKKHFVIQDYYLPQEGAKKLVVNVLNRYKITPLWICPIRSTTTEQLFSPHLNKTDQLLFDIGVYGIPDQTNAEDVVKELEDMTHQLNGKKMFYCSTYISKEQFWNLYPQNTYLALRKKYAAEIMPDITEKVLC